MKVRNFKHYTGTFKGFPYDKVMVYCDQDVKPDFRQKDDGSTLEYILPVVPMSFAVNTDTFPRGWDAEWFAKQIGKECRVFYNQYGKPDFIDILEDQ